MKKFRLAKVEDALQILNVYRPYVTSTPITFEVEMPTLANFTDRISENLKKFPWLVCEIDNQIVGYAYAGTFKNRCAYAWSVETTVYIHENFHKRGIGKELYLKLFEIIRQQGAVNIIAGITLPNAASVGLHEGLGFVKVAQFKDVGFKLGRWWDVGYWQLQLQKPLEPEALSPYSVN